MFSQIEMTAGLNNDTEMLSARCADSHYSSPVDVLVPPPDVHFIDFLDNDALQAMNHDAEVMTDDLLISLPDFAINDQMDIASDEASFVSCPSENERGR